MHLSFPIKGLEKENIPVSEVRTEIRKIEEHYFGEPVNESILDRLNNVLENKINKPYGLIIKAELIRNVVKLYGYNDDSRIVLDPNCNIEFISKKRTIRRQLWQ